MNDTLKLDPEQLAQLRADFTDALAAALLENERLRIEMEVERKYHVALVAQINDELAQLRAFADTHFGPSANSDPGELTVTDNGGVWVDARQSSVAILPGHKEDAPHVGPSIIQHLHEVGKVMQGFDEDAVATISPDTQVSIGSAPTHSYREAMESRGYTFPPEGWIPSLGCRWTPMVVTYSTECGREHGPTLAGQNYCPFCGRPISLSDNIPST